MGPRHGAPGRGGRSTSGRIAAHLRRNVVGYLALFVALSATAWAAPKITSKQIAKNAVKSKQIKDGQVSTADVADGSLTGAKLAGEAVTTEKLAGESVTAAKLADGATLAELADDDGSGSGLDADQLDGISSNGFAAADHTHSGGPGGSIVDGTITNADISNLAAIAESKLDSQMGVITGRVTGLDSVSSFQFGGATGFTNATLDGSAVETLSPAVPVTVSALSARLTAAPGASSARQIALQVDGTDTIGCVIVTAGTTCDTGSAAVTIPANSVLRLRIVKPIGNPDPSDLLFGWRVR